MAEGTYTWGAVPVADGEWAFRLWAPSCDRVTLRLEDRDIGMLRDARGWHVARQAATEGMTYGFVLPDGLVVPDPASRRQSGDVHAPSVLTAPRAAPFWRGRPWEEAVIYELHVGTFTEDGTFRAAMEDLPRLAGLGITAVEIMPVAQFGGDRGWGYDGVLPYAPHPAYGTPQDLADFVAAAHAAGMMVLLDVVYNHFGPDGNYIGAYAADFFDPNRHTPWGAGIDYARPEVRRFFIENAYYWLAEFGFDGLRLDAVDQIVDPTEPELLVELAQELRTRLPDRPVHLTTEDNRNVTHLHERGAHGEVLRHTAEWNDDFHNAAHVLLTGETEGYYADFADEPTRHLARALAEGFAFQGESGRGAPSGHLPPAAFVDFLQNHDQTGNRALGERLAALADPAAVDAMTAVHLLSPHIPLIFMGEEYGETRPFLFFAGFGGALGDAVREGRRSEFADFAGFSGGPGDVPDPVDPATRDRSRLDRALMASEAGRAHMDRVRGLLALRGRHVTPRLERAGARSGRVLLAERGALAIDWRLDGATLRLRARFGPDAPPLPEAAGAEIHRSGPDDAPCLAIHHIEMHA
ncbi:malto-oligosyltrehalose trehalohydrolase [Roseivivax isoporae]|uniref:Malto-oligosyltrehalose trehalohydrolase n=1 Tax=Roseivivax isoporae LMG 25204 TaxID=1449351 RepID=X7F912_9RHOB|nr:malto-oligosyltrehalose trehalohydrolase [Roseivivax isoporae]ETX29305.1 malto-oligosyltrehalose trehalohydrolase [Roseivivax isoporae LMG 25204]